MKNLLERGASLVIGAHLGRPKGEFNSDLSLAPVAKRLQELFGQPVDFQNKKCCFHLASRELTV
jgi:phosphoglycerate kinase